MAKAAITEQYLTDIADAIRSKTGMSSATYKPSQMAAAIMTISGGGGITPTGTISITENGTYNVTSYASASVSVPTGSTINNQNKTVNPSTLEQSVTADSGYTGLGTVTITAMPNASFGANTQTITKEDGLYIYTQSWPYYQAGYVDELEPVWIELELENKTVTPTTSSQTVTPTDNYCYLNSVTVDAMPTGTAGTPTATKGTVSNHSISVTPSVTNTTGYIIGSTKTGTAVTVSASELVSGNKAISSNGTNIDVTNYATVSVSVDSGGSTPVIDELNVTPSETAQTFNSSSVDGYKPVTVGAISSTYVGSGITRRSSTDLTASGATVTAPAGYYSAAASKSVTTMTLPTSASASATSGYTSKATIGRSTSAQYINIPPGYNSAGAYYVISAVANGSATGPSTVSGTSATVSTGTNTLTLTKTGVSTTPTVSAGYVSSATSSTATVTLTASVTTKAAATITPGTTNQTIASGTYLTGTQTISGDANLVANNIKKDVSIFGVTGAYEGSGGGGGGLTVATATATPSSASSSISFTNLAGEPTSFAVVSAADLATGASPWKTAAVVFDGTDLHGQTIRNTSNAQVTYDGSSFSKTYSNGTLTITGSGTNFQANQYKLVYTYGGSDIGTADVQVGSGATSITFTGLEEEPSYFSCIFKSNFSTSSGYQRVITVVYDGTSTYGMEMDSSAKYSAAHWSYSYNNGSLTISSSGTNAGGYFHQPGYYQLTYATEGATGNYQSKTVYATSSEQVITADSAYDALKKVTIPAVTTTNLIASNIVSGVTVQVGDAADSDRIASVAGNVVLQNYYTGSSTPSSATGSNGDLYFQT